MTARALIIAAPASGCGKTTVTLGILAAARRRGIRVRAAKCGPDYIDPAFHAVATGRASFNLDSWTMTDAQLGAVASDAAEDAELLVVEAAMGLFDGVAGEPGRAGSAADIAGRLGAPVVLVLDVAGQFQSAAAVARGFASHAPGVQIAGVVLNRLGGERHRAGVAAAMAAIGMPVLGALPRDEAIRLPERHLGLVQAAEHPDLVDRLDRLAELAERCLALDDIFGLAAPLALRDVTAPPLLAPPGARIAVARDEAFSFIYPHLLQGWRREGSEIVFFSPLADEVPLNDCDACWLPGGYPELHARRLAAADRFRRGLAAFAETRPVHGECGGYMVLGQAIEAADGTRHRMSGLLSHSTSFATRKLTLGYRRAVLRADGPIGRAGSAVRGHEFHYATIADPGADDPLADLSDAAGAPLAAAGGRRGRVTGGFFHAVAREP